VLNQQPHGQLQKQHNTNNKGQ